VLEPRPWFQHPFIFSIQIYLNALEDGVDGALLLSWCACAQLDEKARECVTFGHRLACAVANFF